MESSDLKDALFDDDVLVELVGEHGLDEVLEAVLELKATVVQQLREDAETGWRSERNPRWRNGATAIVIRAKSRIQALERTMERRESGNLVDK